MSTETAKKNIPGTTFNGTWMFLESNDQYFTQVSVEIETRITATFLQIIAQQRVGFSSVYRNWVSLFWTHKSGCNPKPLQRLPGTRTMKTRNKMRTVPRMILILYRVLLSTVRLILSISKSFCFHNLLRVLDHQLRPKYFFVHAFFWGLSLRSWETATLTQPNQITHGY